MRRVAFLVVIVCVFAHPRSSAGTEGETYPSIDDQDLQTAIDNWFATIPTSVVSGTLCTGSVTQPPSSSPGEAWQPYRAPGVTPSGPWYPLSSYKGKGKIASGANGSTEIRFQGGGDTDESGNDSYALIRFVMMRANLFLWAAIECEDAAKFEWAIRVQGQEKVVYTNGSTLSADTLKLSNTASIEWRRRIVDFDAKASELDEEKEIIQNWSGKCWLIDGSSIFDGTRFHRIVPEATTSGFTVNLGVGAKIGKTSQGTEISASGTLGIGWSESNQSSAWSELEEDSANDAPRGPQSNTVVLTGSAPCPTTKKWFCTTYFDAKLAVNDNESFNGSKGARNELTVKIRNFIHDFTVTDCWPCGYVREPTDPVPPPPTPTTPPSAGGGELDPETPITPSANSKKQCGFLSPGGQRDFDGDGKNEGIVFGEVDPFAPGGWCGAPYFLGIGQVGTDPDDGYIAIERWSVGDYALGDNVTGALIDPWRTGDGTAALVVVKNIVSGTCTLREIDRDQSEGSYNEIWPDRTETIPCTMYGTNEVTSESLSSLLPSEYVSGGYLTETEIEGNMTTVLHVIVIQESENEVPGADPNDPLISHVTYARYAVTKNGQGDLVLTELEPQ